MSTLFNLNIQDYNKKELEELFSLSFPYTKDDVVICGHKMKSLLFEDPNLKVDDKDKVVKFVENAKNQLMGRLTNSVLEPTLKKSKIIDSGGHMLIVPPTERLNKSFGKWGGTVNPFSTEIWGNSDKMVNKVINIDSLFRENYYNTKATDFRFSLPEPIKNVVSMSLSALELPLSIYAVSAELGNNFFRIAWQGDVSGATNIIIPDGNYTDGMISCGTCECQDAGAVNPASMAHQLNYEFARPYLPGSAGDHSDSSGGTDGLIGATIDQRTGKIVIAAIVDISNGTTQPIKKIELFFNSTSPAYTKAGAATDLGTPIQQKLGWMLGYRFAVYTGASAYVTEGRYDFRGPRYLYLVVNDHNNNHIGDHVMGAFSSSMTSARENILARLSWKQYAFFSTNNTPLDRSERSSVSRNYFGPVDIQHLNIKILDQYGRIISLNNMDFAMALNFSILYG